MKQISLKPAIIGAAVLMILSFGSGWLTANKLGWPGAQTVIRGADQNATSTFGDLLNKDGKAPAYLTKDVDFNLFWDVWDIVKSEYYRPDMPETQMFYGALSGLVSSLGDPYSVFMTAEDSSDFSEELKGNFEGIGAEIGIRNNELTIIAPLSDSPAIKAGLKAKDIVIAVDGKDVTKMSLNDAIKLIRGKSGTVVTLKVYRAGWSEAKEIKITRAAITVKSVEWEFKNNVAVIKVRQFNGDTMPLFSDAIMDILKHPKVKSIILDLRDNPGGYLDSAVAMAGEWAKDRTVVIEKGRDKKEVKHVSDTTPRLADYPTVVLINGGSASGSEIVAGALQDWGKAKLVGETSFGKGSVQTIVELPDGSSVKITIALWYTPNDRSINEKGIEPDAVVKETEEDNDKFLDPQMDAALKILNP